MDAAKIHFFINTRLHPKDQRLLRGRAGPASGSILDVNKKERGQVSDVKCSYTSFETVAMASSPSSFSERSLLKPQMM